MNLLDASALLAFLRGEDGADAVEAALVAGSSCGAANWSEVTQKTLQRGGDWGLVSGLLLGYGLVVESVTAADAEAAARLWRPGTTLSLADRLCLAQGARLQATVWTADREWGSSDGVRQIRGAD